VANGQNPPKAGVHYKRRSETPVSKTAKQHRRRLLGRLGLHVPDLDPITAERLMAWSIARAILDWSTSSRTRVSAFNCEQRAFALLEERLAVLRPQSDPLSDLAAQGKAIRERREQADS